MSDMIGSTAKKEVIGDVQAGAAPSGKAPAGDIEAFRRQMRRFAGTYAKLPAATQASCPVCRKVVPAVFDRAGRQIVLTYDCPGCGRRREVHEDAIWSQLVSERPHSPKETYAGAPIQPVLRHLPRTVETLCPECCAVVLGRYFVEDGAVHIEKTCPEHGYFRDCVNSDVLMYSKAAWISYEEGPGLKDLCRPQGNRCPSDCGVCRQHQSGTVLAQVDLTNRCNMRCPVCFANAGVSGQVYEPGFEQVVERLRALRAMRPFPATALQFSGGEPTLHPDFLRLVRTAREMGFSHIQIASNGIRLADPDFARAAAEAEVHTLYLQFDGIGEEAYRYTRNYPGLWAKKLACIDNCRRLGMKVCLVPTIVRGVNDDQVGKIFRFAVENIDTVSSICYQPVSFSGRIDPGELARKRYTLGHLAHDIAQASGASLLRDMYPASLVQPLSQFLEAVTGQPKIHASCHPDCAFGTYFLVSPEGKAYPLPQVVDADGLFTDMNRLAHELRGKGGKLSWLDKLRIYRMFKRHFHKDGAPPDLDVGLLVKSLQGMLDKKVGRGESGKGTYRTLLCAGMHFMDRYNYDVQRVKRCVILYSTPAGMFPFCTHNCGPEFRRFTVADPSRSADRVESPVAGGAESKP